MLTLEQMTPEQKLGRVLCCRRFNEQDDIDFTLELVKNNACGAIQMTFNEERRPGLVKLFREAADYPVIMVNDMELGYPTSKLPKLPLSTLAAANNPEYAKLFGAALAKEAKEAGFNGIWGPIIDIRYENGPCSFSRLAGDTAETVLNVTKDIYKAFASYGFHATGKHYPGDRCMPLDSHMVAPHSANTKEDIIKTSLVPYLELMKENLLPAIMVGHHICDNIDPDTPASLSKKVIDIIREQGFDGVIYSDSLAMISILQTYGEKQAYAKCLMAGVDILLPNYRTTTREVYNMMLEAYREGLITDERLDEAVRRVMALEQYCAQEPTNPVPVPENVGEILSMATRDCISADCDEGVAVAIDPNKKRLMIVEVPVDFAADAEVSEEVATVAAYNANNTIRAIQEHFPNSDIELIPEFPSPKDNDRVLTAASKYDEVVFVSFCVTAPYMGTDCLTRRIEAVINALALPGKLTALVHFGNPLALENLFHIPRKIFGYCAPASQGPAIEVLAGKYPAKGKNPCGRLSAELCTKK